MPARGGRQRLAAVEGRDRPGNYAHADEPGISTIVFELDSVDDARRYTDDFPLTKAGFLEWFFIPLTVPLPIKEPVPGRD